MQRYINRFMAAIVSFVFVVATSHATDGSQFPRSSGICAVDNKPNRIVIQEDHVLIEDKKYKIRSESLSTILLSRPFRSVSGAVYVTNVLLRKSGREEVMLRILTVELVHLAVVHKSEGTCVLDRP